MVTELKTIERKAQQAETLTRFKALKISYIKDVVNQILNEIGKNGIFEQYTKHDITHINAMLDIAYMIVPDTTKEVMTPAEWLLLTLAIYFHDMGMVVTRDEYENRSKSNFSQYKQRMVSGEFGKDFIAKVNSLNDPDRFLYQEFVREHHAERVASWVKGEKTQSWGSCDAVYNEIQKIINEFDELFRNDLALVCLSHHKNDLGNIEIYKLEEIFDESPNSKANLQYVSIILRTADLMHITSDRTPTIAYHIINPNDPKSIIEWEKQSAVRAVLPKSSSCDSESKSTAPQYDTFSVRAFFSRKQPPEAYFGLISYLNFAREQINADGKLVAASESKEGAKGYTFPWKYIDDSGIDTEGFEKKQFQFTIDQNAILQLLIGHTLYNDSSVVLRELIQNSIDAIKYQNLLETNEGIELTQGKISFNWDSVSRSLSITDNGTGMSMYDVENYLLKVGASKYRSEEFIRMNPNFNAISRFGIGILTCFMVADDIDIYTSCQSEKSATLLSIRNLHGKYLVKRIDKSNTDYLKYEHGTNVILHLHEDVVMSDLETNLRYWVVYPPFEVTLTINNKNRKVIGYRSPKDALENFFSDDAKPSEVFQETKEGVTLAFVTFYNRYFEDYSIRSYQSDYRDDISKEVPIGVCIDGIRVSDNSPGFENRCLMACCNITSADYAKTNVARSTLEANASKKELLSIIYQIYANHINKQFEKKRAFLSLTKAADECKPLLSDLWTPNSHRNDEMRIEDYDVFGDVFSNLSQIVVEIDGERKLVSAADVGALENLAVFQSRVLYSADIVLAEAQNQVNYSQLMKFLGIRSFDSIKANEVLLCDFDRNYLLHRLAIDNKEVTSIEADTKVHSAIIRLGKSNKRWVKIQTTSRSIIYNSVHPYLYLPLNDITFSGLSNECGVKTWLGIFLVPDLPITNYFKKVASKFNLTLKEENWECVLIVSVVYDLLVWCTRASQIPDDEQIEGYLEARMERELKSDLSSERFFEVCDRIELFSLAKLRMFEIFDPEMWNRKVESSD